jgi:hypothetical protein
MRKNYINLVGLLLLVFLWLYDNFRPANSYVYIQDDNLMAIGKGLYDGKKEGFWFLTDINLSDFSIGYYKNNEKDGTWIDIFKDLEGREKSWTTFYINGQANGIRYAYDNKGKVIEKQICEDDLILYRTEFADDSLVWKPSFTNPSVSIPEIFTLNDAKIIRIHPNNNYREWIKYLLILSLVVFNITQIFIKKHRLPVAN